MSPLVGLGMTGLAELQDRIFTAITSTWQALDSNLSKKAIVALPSLSLVRV
jgi:hypothetical protein